MSECGTCGIVLWGMAAGMACLFVSLCLTWRGSVAVGRHLLSGHVLFGLFLLFFLFLFGLWRSASAWYGLAEEWPDGERVYRAVLVDVPRVSERSVTADALSYVPHAGRVRKLRKLSLTFSRDSLSERLDAGSRLLFKAQVRRLRNRGNPEEFDYARYQGVKGISGRAFLSSGKWRACDLAYDGESGVPWLTLWRIKALGWRSRLLAFYRQAGMQGEEYALFSAVTLGDKSSLSRDVRDLYAETGVGHILALSGMHLGYLMFVFNFLLLRCGHRRRLRWAVGLSALFLMWTYVFVAGLPASLVRAASMYTLIWGAVMWGRTGVSVHALSAGVFCMLCAEPMYLYDVGFQLSVLAMTGILAVYPLCRKWKVARLPLAGWLVRSLWLSCSAQLFTFPLVGYYFGTFSMYSAWLTLLVSPLTALLLFAMPLLLVAEWGSWVLASWLSVGVGQIIRLQNGLLSHAVRLPFSSVNVDWSFWTVLSAYVWLFVFMVRRYMTYPRWLKCMSVVSLCLAVVWMVEKRRHAVVPCVVFYNNPSCPAVHVIKSPRCSYLFPVYPARADEGMAYIEKTFWRKKLSEPPIRVVADSRNARLHYQSGWARLAGGPSFLMLCDSRWEHWPDSVCADVDYLYLCRGYKGDLKQLSHGVRPRCVVLDASLHAFEREKYMETCTALGWKIHDMETQGALKVALK